MEQDIKESKHSQNLVKTILNINIWFYLYLQSVAVHTFQWWTTDFSSEHLIFICFVFSISSSVYSFSLFSGPLLILFRMFDLTCIMIFYTVHWILFALYTSLHVLYTCILNEYTYTCIVYMNTCFICHNVVSPFSGRQFFGVPGTSGASPWKKTRFKTKPSS